MEITGPVKNEGCQVRAGLAFEFVIKLLDDSRRRAETKLRSPFPRIEDGQMERLVSPRVVQIKMNYARQWSFLGARLKPGVALSRDAKTFRSLGQVRVNSERLFVLDDCLRRSTLAKEQASQIAVDIGTFGIET